MSERRLAVTGPKTLAFEAFEQPVLGEGEVWLQTMFSGISAGTELSQYRGTSPFMNRQWMPDDRLFRDGPPSWTYPVRNLGYENVGMVMGSGPGVRALHTGQWVFGTWGHRTGHVMQERDAVERLIPQGAPDPRIGIFSHIGAVALNGVHDAKIRVGDLVVVFGLGVPGQIVMQLARAAGAEVIGVDPVASRRDLAERLGATRTINPDWSPVAEVVKSETGGRGADVCIEVSGNPRALAEAMRTVAYSSRVVCMGFMQGEARGLMLGEEFHHNRIEVVSSQISGVAPEASHRWTKLRLWQTAVRLQHEGVLNLTPLITHAVPFDAAPAMFEKLDQGDPAIMQSVLTFGWNEDE